MKFSRRIDRACAQFNRSPTQKRFTLGLTVLLILFTARAGADDVSSPGDEDPRAPSTGAKPLWEVGLAGGVGSFADYPGSDQYRERVLPLPFFIYRGGIFRSDASGPRLHTDVGNVEFEVSGGGSLSSNSSRGPREGMPELDNLLEIGPNAKITVGKPTASSRVLVDVPVRAAVSTNFSSRFNWRGVIFAPDVAYEDTALFGSSWGGRFGLGVQATTSQLQEYWYQVAPQYAEPNRPAYEAHAGYLGSRLTLSAYRPITRNFNVYLSGEFDDYSGAASRDSPLFRSRTGFGVIIGFAWSIWQSPEREAVKDTPAKTNVSTPGTIVTQ